MPISGTFLPTQLPEEHLYIFYWRASVPRKITFLHHISKAEYIRSHKENWSRPTVFLSLLFPQFLL